MTYILNGWPLLSMDDVVLMEVMWLSAGLSSAKLSEHLLAQLQPCRGVSVAKLRGKKRNNKIIK